MKDRIIYFLEEYVLGRNLFTEEVIYKLDDGKLEGVYSDQMTFSDLVKTENGFKLNLTTITKEIVYNLDQEGERNSIAKNFTGTSVFGYEFAQRKSTKQITGYMRCVSTTVQNQTMEAVVNGIFDVILDNNQLRWQERQLLYRDNPVGEGEYKAVSFHSKNRFYVENGKLIFEFIPTLWDVNTDTLELSLAKDDYPPYVSKER